MTEFTGVLFWNKIRSNARAGRRGNLSIDAKGVPPGIAGFLMGKYEIHGGSLMAATVRQGGQLPACLRQVLTPRSLDRR